MSFLVRIFGGKRERETYRPLYASVVNAGRDRYWYSEGQVPDTIDGRFDMISAILALVLIRLEREGDRTRTASVLLTEIFIEDMEGTVRQIGIGDLMVGKHVGKMMGALGGRLGAFRAASAGETGWNEPVSRNIFHDSPPSPAAVEGVGHRLATFDARLRGAPTDELLKGVLPSP